MEQSAVCDLALAQGTGEEAFEIRNLLSISYTHTHTSFALQLQARCRPPAFVSFEVMATNTGTFYQGLVEKYSRLGDRILEEMDKKPHDKDKVSELQRQQSAFRTLIEYELGRQREERERQRQRQREEWEHEERARLGALASGCFSVLVDAAELYSRHGILSTFLVKGHLPHAAAACCWVQQDRGWWSPSAQRTSRDSFVSLHAIFPDLALQGRTRA